MTAPHAHVFDQDGDCIACGANQWAPPADSFAPMTERQRLAWERDVPAACPCDYIWTGMVWTRSGAASLCDLHGREAQP